MTISKKSSGSASKQITKSSTLSIPAAKKNPTIVAKKIRNLTSDAEVSYGAQTYFCNVLSDGVHVIGTEANLREYLGETNDKRRTVVHKEIGTTIEEKPERMIQYNSGLTAICSAAQVNQDQTTITLVDGSLVNGGQTQGEILRHIKTRFEQEDEPNLFEVRMEIIVEPDQNEHAQIALARNKSTAVKNISVAGKLKHLDDLKLSMETYNSDYKIAMNETDEGINPQLVLQIARCFMPSYLLGKDHSPTDADILKSYKQSAVVLQEFCNWDNARKNGDKTSAEKYEFIVQIAPIAYDEYLKWNSHPSWQGKNLQKVYKEDGKATGKRPGTKLPNGSWTDMAKGIIFPILSSLSYFVIKDAVKGWTLSKPSIFDEDDHIIEAIQIFRANDFDPNRMGRAVSAYISLGATPRTIVKLLKIKQP